MDGTSLYFIVINHVDYDIRLKEGNKLFNESKCSLKKVFELTNTGIWGLTN